MTTNCSDGLKKLQYDALTGSIEKWTKIVFAIEHGQPFIENGTEDCECCHQFYQPHMRGCGACPIAIDSGRLFCRDTPYVKWNMVQDYVTMTTDSQGSVTYTYEPVVLQAALSELQYLIDLAKKYSPT